MSYSIKTILHHTPDKQGLLKIQLLIIYKRMKFTLPTNYKVLPAQFDNGRCKGFRNAGDMNGNLINLKEKYEKLLLGVIESNPDKDTLKLLFSEKVPEVSFTTFCTYAFDLIKRLTGKVSEGRLRHYRTVVNHLKDFGDIPLNKVSPTTALAFEKHLRLSGNQQNTLNSKMTIFITIVNHAITEKLLPRDCLYGYKKPVYKQKLPDHLTEAELNAFKSVVDAIVPVHYKTAGYYFLLSCYLGYRISDLESFDYNTAVKGDKILIRAAKNNKIVMIPIYPKLAEILEKVKQYPFYFTQQTMRKYVKELALMAGLNRKIKVHTARNTFAIMLMEKGFSLEETAHLLGDSIEVARLYARITDKQLHKNVRERLG